jgi:nitrite reductase (NO-forming)
MKNLNIDRRRVRPFVGSTIALLAAAMLLMGVACGRDAGMATATPEFSLPTALPSPEAVPTAGAGGEATAAAMSGYWEAPRTWEPEDVSTLERVTQELVAPPFFPEHEQVYDGEPRVVEVRMVVEEKEIEVAPGVFMWAFTFDGSVPGPMIVVHEGDYVELTLVNPSSNELLHNIDFHASSGALGGGSLTQVGPGQEVVLRFRALKPGVYIYHCAPGGTMVPWHVTHGMNGAVMVIPKDGLKDPAGNPITYDRAYYVGEQDYYIPQDENGEFKRYDAPSASMVDDLEVMKTLIPTHIVFNGVTGALQGDGQLTANVGENVLIVHSQANRQSYPHLIGGHGDYVWERGSFTEPPETGLETWVIAAGSAGASIHAIRQPGTYVYLSHNLIEAFAFDAKAILVAEGEWDNDLMEQVTPPSAIQ